MVAVTHAFVSAVPDGGDSSVVQPSDWNDPHVVDETLTISNKTTAYTVVAADLGTIINCTSGTFSVTLTAAATLGTGFNCWIWNTSATYTDAITIDPSGAETIDGKATLILRRGEGMQIVCDGTNWQTGEKKTMRGYADNLLDSGNRPIATGQNSVAIGRGATGSGTDSYAVGRDPVASGTSALAVGYLVTASANYATAIGQNSGATGSQAVTGSGSMALGGSYASGTDSFAAAITNNTSSYGATGANSVALAYQAKASGSRSYAIGYQSTASGNDATALGYYCTASGAGSFAKGGQGFALATASGTYSCAWNDYAVAAQIGKYAYTSGYAFVAGGAQFGYMVVVKATTDATASVLTSDINAATTTNQVILPNNSAFAFDGLVVSRRQAADGTESAAWKVEGLIRREGSAATTTLVASTVTAISNVPGWTLALTADTTNGGLAVTFTGAAATDIRTVANIRTVEVTYA